MESKTFYSEIINDHNLHPLHKHDIEKPDIVLEGVNPSCGDDIVLQLKVKDGVITDGSYVGEGCAISQASADIMLDMIIGRTTDEAIALHDKFMNMIKGNATEEDIEELEEAGVFSEISHMPARVKCAVLGWKTVKEAIES
ncbi:MAG: SUF system NifU family Fe-S cluster assembly protein [Lachnospiraceae bacterium]|nr:SUF system NifU family Fe-S cluster assembly protein [Lachnospiraceae bacterium]